MSKFRFFSFIAYFVVVSFLLASTVVNLPGAMMALFQGKMGFSDFIIALALIPFSAALVGCTFAGVPAVLTGASMAFYFHKIGRIAFIPATVVTGVVLEFIYCNLLGVKTEVLWNILILTAVVTAIVCFFLMFYFIRKEPFATE